MLPAHHWMPHNLLPAGEDPGQGEREAPEKGGAAAGGVVGSEVTVLFSRSSS